MKYFLLVVFILFFAGCHKDSETPTELNNPTLGDVFYMKIGETVSIKNEQLNFKFVYVPEDSRCPEGAVCFWAGNAAVIIKIFDVIDTLNTYLNPKEITYDSYKITLLNLSPYPKLGIPKDTTQYIAQFVVTK